MEEVYHMKKAICLILLALCTPAAYAQGTTVLTGTVLTYGYGFNTRTQTRNFTLRIKGQTSDADAARYIGILQQRGQDDLLNSISHSDLGTLSIGNNIGQTVNAIRIDRVGDRTRVRAVLQRWLGFGEVRSGYRSVDYPFTYLELMIDPHTGKGEGTYFGAAKIRFKNDQIEVEDFGTFPGKLLNVRVSGRPLG
jgi:hypothetical protein